MKFCKHCGKQVEADAVECKHCHGSLVEKSVDIKKHIDEGIASVKTHVDEKVSAISERVEKLEKLPAAGAPNLNLKIEKEFKGYKLEKQGLGTLNKIRGREHLFPAFANEEKMHEYKKWCITFVKAMRGDVQSKMELQEMQRKTGLGGGSDSIGGYLVPDEFQADLVMLARDVSFLLQNATVIPMSKDKLLLPTEASIVTPYWVAEKTAPTKSDPSFGQVSLEAKKLFCLTNPVAQELLDDSDVDVVSLLNDQMQYAQGLELDNQALNGTGNPCSGVLSAACGYSVVMGSGLVNFSSVTADHVRSMIRKLSAADAAVGKFVYGKDVQFYMDTLKDTNNRYLYREPSAGRPAALWNRDIIESVKAPAEAASAVSTAFAAFGNWKYFYVGRRKGAMTIDVDPYTNFASDQLVFRMITRWGLAMARASAFCRLITAAS